jgi:hypothetical protein
VPDTVVLARVAFAAAWIGVQAALISTAGSRPDNAFGFRMFAEASTIEAHLTRTVVRQGRTVELPVEDGVWVTHDATGRTHNLSWHDRVKEPILARFDRTFAASYSAAAQVSRWQAALADVALHLEPDGETRALNLQLTVRRNGHDAVVTRTTAAVSP